MADGGSMMKSYIMLKFMQKIIDCSFDHTVLVLVSLTAFEPFYRSLAL